MSVRNPTKQKLASTKEDESNLLHEKRLRIKMSRAGISTHVWKSKEVTKLCAGNLIILNATITHY